MPGQVGTPLEAGVGRMEVLGVQVVQVAEYARGKSADAGIWRDKRRHGSPAVVNTVDLAAEAAPVRALLERVHTVVANASGERQSLRDEVEVHGDEPRPLGIATLDVVEEHVARGAHVGVTDSGQQCRAVGRIERRGTDRIEIRARAVVPVGLLVDVVSLVEPADQTPDAPIVRRAQAYLVAQMRVFLVVGPEGTG